IALLALQLPLNALAAGTDDNDSSEDEQQSREQHNAHEHGAARLTVATTRSGLEITLDSPAANLFGFEHIASTEAQHQAIHSAVEILEDGSTLFPGSKEAECTQSRVEIESVQVARHHEEKHGDDHGDDEHNHESEGQQDDDHEHEAHQDAEQEKQDTDDGGDDHEHEAHQDAGNAGDHEHEHEDGAGGHSDVTVLWQFDCTQPQALTRLETRLFQHFPQGFNQLQVEWLTADSAGSQVLEQDGVISLVP
ncbi:MAG: DUF2796 domain-containing protein, partial [Thiothrix sp.]|nr:DUF2796 domain-containing protein [Thiothrix sp.]